MSMPKLWSNFWGTMAQTFRVGGPSGPPAALLGPIVGTLPADIYLDPVAGSDLNPGTSSDAALKTFAGVLGTIGDDYGSSVTIHLLSSQTPGSERIIFNPKLRGSTTNLTIDGSAGIVWGGTFGAGTVTQFQWGATGHAMTIANLPGTPVVGQIIQNQTRGTYAVIRALSGSTATLTVPQTIASLFLTTPDLSWLTGDTIRVGTLPYLNLEAVNLTGGDSTPSFTTGVLQITHVRVPDSSGTAGSSSFTLKSGGALFVTKECVFDSSAYQPTTGFTAWVGCLMLGGCELHGASVSGGASTSATLNDTSVESVFTTSGFVLFYGDCGVGGMACEGTGNGQVNVSDNAAVNLLGSTATQGYGSLWGFGCHLALGNGAVMRQSLPTNPSPAWSPLLSFADGQLFFTSGTHGIGNGSSFVPNTVTWHTGIPLTIAGLDAWGTISDGCVSDASGTISAPYSGAAFVSQFSPQVPPSWTQTTWNIDPQNSQGTSSDNNSGLTSGTALLTWKAVVAKWGTNSPTLRQATLATFLSSHTDNTDPVFPTPIHANGGYLAFAGNTPTATAAVFTLNTAKNRAAGSNSLLSGSFSAGTPAAGVMIENTTSGKSSRAIVHKTAGGANWNLTQPLAKLSVPTTTLGPTEVDTWASTDTVNVLSLVAVNIAGFLPTIIDQGTSNYGYLYQLAVFDPGGVGVDPCRLNGCVQAMEVIFQRGVSYVQEQNTIAGSNLTHDGGLINCYYLGGLFISATNDTCFVVGGGTNNFTSSYGEAVFDGDYVAGGFGFNFFGGLFSLGYVCLDSNMHAYGASVLDFGAAVYAASVLYGTTGKTVNFTGTSRAYVRGTFTATWTLANLIAPGVLLNGVATGNSAASSGGVVTIHSGIATTVANLDAAAGASGFGGIAFNFAGASLSRAA